MEIGVKLTISLLTPFLKTGQALEIFHNMETVQDFKQKFNRMVKVICNL